MGGSPSSRIQCSPALALKALQRTLPKRRNDAFTRMQSVIDAIVAQGVAREDIKTRSINISTEYDQQDRTKIRAYRVSSSVQVQIRNVSTTSQVIDAAVAAGANRVDGISFAVADQTPYKDQARALAMANARQKADQLASLAGMRIVAVKAISRVRRNVYAGALGASGVRGSRGRPGSGGAGEQEVRTQVSVVYIIE